MSPVSFADHPRLPGITARAPALTIHPAGIWWGREATRELPGRGPSLPLSGWLAGLKEGHASDQAGGSYEQGECSGQNQALEVCQALLGNTEQLFPACVLYGVVSLPVYNLDRSYVSH